jgi:hypothetical protein
MKLRLSAFFLSAFLACVGQVRANTLPDSCGDDKVKFDVRTKAGQPLPTGPVEGNAEIVFIETKSK